jgi:TonB-dependent SusC/RagA subfamily outer membrane receptor
MKRIVYAIALCIIFFDLNAYCQDNSVVKNAVAGLKTLLGNHVIEKAYLHFDKPYYAAGNTIYFKAYVTLGERYDLSKASGILYVDLIDPKNTIIKSIKLQLLNGVAWGDFSLPFSFPQGNYRVRAYTRYMQNDADYFFDQTVPVGSVMNTATTTYNTAQAAKADLQFFPEGGEMVTAMISKVAFKAIGTNGLGVNVKGVIVDNTDKQVAAFTSAHLGMGTFYLLPEAGKTYKAKVTFADGTQNTFALPVPASKGIALSVQDTLGKMSVDIRCNKAYLEENLNKDISLVIYAGGTVNTVNTKLDSRILSMNLPNSQFPSGIAQVTLFSQSGEPLSERLLFLQNPDLVNLTVGSKKTSYGKRERVSININANDKGADVEGHFSAAVIDESKVPFDENNETTILTYLLLTADLRGYVEQPNYYFIHNTAQTYTDLDALMLTQGYRRFTWKQLLSDMDTKFIYEPEKTLEITGIAKTASGSPVTSMDVMLLTPNSGSMLGDRTGNDGKFNFINLPPFADSTLFTLQATGSTKTRGTTFLTAYPDKAGPAVEDKKLPGLQNDVNASMITYLSNSQAQNGASYNSVTIHPAGEQHADQVVAGDEIAGSASLIAALNGRLRDVNFIKGLPYLKGMASKDPMLIVIDGKIRGSYINLDEISPGAIGKVEVLKGSNTDSYGIYGNAGVLAITSRAGSHNQIMQDASYKYTSKSVTKQKNVYENDSKKDNYQSSNYGGSGHADQVIKGDAFKNSPSLSQGLSGLVAGVNFSNGMPYLPVNIVLSGGATVVEPMYVILDGTPYTSTGVGINDINPNTVETVEILKGANASIYGMNGGGGVMVITTRHNGTIVTNDATALGSLAFRPRGFYKAREFYSPKYENTTTGNDRRDLRSTIFWVPEITTNKDGNASFEYYNGDGRGTYRVVIEGIDDKGNIGRQIYRYKVE